VTAGKNKKLLFALTKKDFDFQTFCTGGNGGGHRNAKQNGVRCIHRESGSVGEHRDGRDQYRNKQEAFKKCVTTDIFKRWHKAKVALLLSQTPTKTIDQIVDEQMQEQNLKIEVFDVPRKT
jgi:protein subunit release factor B